MRTEGPVGVAAPPEMTVLARGAGASTRTGAGHFAKHAKPAGAPPEPSEPEAGTSSQGAPVVIAMGMSQGAFAATEAAANPVTSSATTATIAVMRQAMHLRTTAEILLPFIG